MPPINRKRRSDAISRDASPSASSSGEEPSNRPTQQRRRSSTHSSVSSRSSAEPETQADNQRKALVKKLVRLALATEYSRQPLRRGDITTKVFKDGDNSTTTAKSGGAGSFKKVFEDAQTVLRGTFGMELRELPSKEKTGLNERRKQATQQAKATNNTTNRSWILVSVLPKEYREDARIIAPSHAPSQEAEGGYAAFYSFVVSLVYLNSGELAEQKLERYLKRVNADTQTMFGSWEKVNARMVREGYLERRKDTLSGEDVVSYVVGPRGKMEVGVKGVEGLVRSVYGLGAAGAGREGPKMEEEELVKRLGRSLGVENVGVGARESAAQSRTETPQPAQSQMRRGGRRRRDDDDDDDNDD